MKTNFRRMITSAAAVIMAVCTALSAAGCKGDEQTYQEREQLIEELYGAVELSGTEDSTGGSATTSNFTLAYSKEDATNPYMCKSTLNATMTELVYDQLITVNSEFEAEMVIAYSVEYTGNRSITVILRDGVVFSDGTELTAKDIIYSFNAATKDGSRYKKSLSNFLKCSGSGNRVYFHLDKPDPRAYMLLDFPIIKAESDANGAAPIGSGRYVYYSDILTGTYLLRNEKWYKSNNSNMERISLTSMPTVESIVHSVEIGTISYYYTDLRFIPDETRQEEQNGQTVTITDEGYNPTRINAHYSTVDINNLVYLGINTADPTLVRTDVRKAISLALDREDIITASFAGRAYAATGPLTTSWPKAAAAQSGSTLSSVGSAISALESDGFINEDDTRRYHRYNENGDYLEYTLLVNNKNDHHLSVAEQIAGQLEEAGIGITIEPLSFERLSERIALGQYDLYLAEYALLNNMDFSDLFTPNRGYYYGNTPQQTIESWNSYLNGVATIETVIQSFEAEIPFIPVCYRLGIACHSRSLKAAMNVSESDPFWGMENWDVALAQ